MQPWQNQYQFYHKCSYSDHRQVIDCPSTNMLCNICNDRCNHDDRTKEWCTGPAELVCCIRNASEHSIPKWISDGMPVSIQILK